MPACATPTRAASTARAPSRSSSRARHNPRVLHKTTSLALLLAVVAGCAGEPPRIPADLPRTGAAVVRAWSPGDVRVDAIDGVEVGRVSHVLVAPGMRQLTV